MQNTRLKKIIVGSDHAGLELKEKVKAHLEKNGFQVKDVGTHTADSVDYPVFAEKVCREILNGNFDRGILVCGTGLGMSYTANRHKKIRAALCTSPLHAKMAASHNSANVLCLGGRVTKTKLANKITDTWLSTVFEGGRHIRRIKMIDTMAQKRSPL